MAVSGIVPRWTECLLTFGAAGRSDPRSQPRSAARRRSQWMRTRSDFARRQTGRGARGKLWRRYIIRSMSVDSKMERVFGQSASSRSSPWTCSRLWSALWTREGLGDQSAPLENDRGVESMLSELRKFRRGRPAPVRCSAKRKGSPEWRGV